MRLLFQPYIVVPIEINLCGFKFYCPLECRSLLCLGVPYRFLELNDLGNMNMAESNSDVCVVILLIFKLLHCTNVKRAKPDYCGDIGN